jgi:YD repeat-containing protein
MGSSKNKQEIVAESVGLACDENGRLVGATDKIARKRE